MDRIDEQKLCEMQVTLEKIAKSLEAIETNLFAVTIGTNGRKYDCNPRLKVQEV